MSILEWLKGQLQVLRIAVDGAPVQAAAYAAEAHHNQDPKHGRSDAEYGAVRSDRLDQLTLAPRRKQAQARCDGRRFALGQ